MDLIIQRRHCDLNLKNLLGAGDCARSVGLKNPSPNLKNNPIMCDYNERVVIKCW